MEWIPIVLVTFKILVFGTGMFFAIKWHYDQGKREKDRRAVLLAGGKVSDVRGPDSGEGDWGSRNTNPPANPTPAASGDEIVSEDEILESELTEDDLTSGSSVGLKVAAADGKKANTR